MDLIEIAWAIVADLLVPDAALLSLVQLARPLLIEYLGEVVPVFVRFLGHVNDDFAIVQARNDSGFLSAHNHHSVTDVVVLWLSAQVWQRNVLSHSLADAVGGFYGDWCNILLFSEVFGLDVSSLGIYPVEVPLGLDIVQLLVESNELHILVFGRIHENLFAGKEPE